MGLEERVQRLEDRERIKELRAEYCYRIDEFDVEGFAALFSQDATLEFGPAGTFHGRDGIREFAENVVCEEYGFLSHMVHNPVIDVEGDESTGRWYFEVPCTQNETGNAGWIQGRYDEKYRRVDGDWLFAEIVASFNYIADYKEGWADIIAEHH